MDYSFHCQLVSLLRSFHILNRDGLVQGLVRAVGVSNYGPKQLLKIYEYLEARGVPLVSAQVLFKFDNTSFDTK